MRPRTPIPIRPGAEAKALHEVLHEICRERDGRMSSRRLASWLRRHCDRIADGKRIVRAGEKDHTLLWKVEAAK
jgi:hypothetical protein